MYTYINYKTKKSLKEAIASGEDVRVFQPNGDLTGSNPPTNGKVYLKGPHYPQPHRWYAEAWVENGRVVKVK